MSVDYLPKYLKNNTFNISALINDDLVQPIRLLYNAKHYVSATKLLLIAIDTVGFIEYGDESTNTFIKWLNEHSKINELGISAEELWEHRNGLLHMSSISSRKVKSGATRTLVAYVGEIPKEVVLDQTKTGYYDLYKLIKIFGYALVNWLQTYNEQPSKMEFFIKRYDLIVSDARMLSIKLDNM